MAETRVELRDDLMALLAASRELPADSDADLATVFLGRLQQGSARRRNGTHWQVSKRAVSIALLGAIWLGAAAILLSIPYYYYTHDSDVLSGYYSQTVPIVLIVAVALSLVVCAASVTGWRVPRIRVTMPVVQEDR